MEAYSHIMFRPDSPGSQNHKKVVQESDIIRLICPGLARSQENPRISWELHLPVEPSNMFMLCGLQWASGLGTGFRFALNQQVQRV
jgi:hypothetical protein